MPLWHFNSPYWRIRIQNALLLQGPCLMHVNLNAYAGERQLYSSDTDQVALNRRLDNELTVMVNWFRENGLMANPSKFQTMVLGSKKWGCCFVASEIVIDEYDNINLVGINVDNQLKYQTHLKYLWTESISNSKVLKSVCIRPYIAFFLYCSCVWAFCSDKL